MKLEHLIKDIDNMDNELIIFQKDKLDLDGEIFLHNEDNIKNGVMQIGDTVYYYLLEVFIVKEFLEGWLENLAPRPTDREIAKRVFEYAINDA
ncbi:MAG: hypothetical protein J0H74_23040 [Chitinophagaceae bacterium]|nr:hypothetical protein [Chitinophagaceae bacterium]